MFWLPSCPNFHLKVQISNSLNLCNMPPDLKKASLVGPSSMLNHVSYEPLSIKLFVKTPEKSGGFPFYSINHTPLTPPPPPPSSLSPPSLSQAFLFILNSQGAWWRVLPRRLVENAPMPS